MRISVVIRALNEEEHIGRLLTGLSRQSRQPDEIILVDSGSQDATVEIATRFGAEVVRISPQKFSFGRSLNLGCEAASGDVIVIPSAHVYPVHDQWLSKLVGPLEDEKVALAYGRQVGDRVTKYAEHRVLAQWFPNESDPDQHHPFCNNANAAVRRAVWEELRYDERLTGLEDVDFAQRLLDSGWRMAYVAEAVIVHVHEETWRQILNRYRREAIAHRRIFHDQRMSLMEAMKLIAWNIIGDAAHAARDGVLTKNLAEIVQFRIAQFLGTYQGFRQRGPVTSEMKRRFYYPGPRPQLTRTVDADSPGTPIDYGGPAEEAPR